MSEPDNDMVTIPRAEYEALKKDAAFLGDLRAAGVDNWDGHDFAIDMRRVREQEEAQKS